MADLIDVYPYFQSVDDLFFLILKRSPHKIFSGQWRMIGGKVIGRETYWEAALRELKEEINVSPVLFWSVPTLNSIYDWNSNTINHIPAFAAQLDKKTGITLDEEHVSYRWIKANEVEDYLFWPEQIRMIRILYKIIINQTILKDWIIKEY